MQWQCSLRISTRWVVSVCLVAKILFQDKEHTWLEKHKMGKKPERMGKKDETVVWYTDWVEIFNSYKYRMNRKPKTCNISFLFSFQFLLSTCFLYTVPNKVTFLSFNSLLHSPLSSLASQCFGTVTPEQWEGSGPCRPGSWQTTTLNRQCCENMAFKQHNAKASDRHADILNSCRHRERWIGGKKQREKKHIVIIKKSSREGEITIKNMQSRA